METQPGQFRSPEEEEAAMDFEAKQEAEESVEQEERKPPFDAVIVLGAGIEDPLWKRFQEQYPEGESPRGVKLTEKSPGWMLGPDARMRTIAAAEMYLQGLTSRIIFTGGRTAEKRGISESEAQQMKKFAQHLLLKGGMSEEQTEQGIVLEDKATNTIENIANVCNIVDQNPEEYRHLAILTNQYHLDRAQELIKKFNLEAQGFKAEDLMAARSSKYQRIIERFFGSPGYQGRLSGERRWTKGLKELQQYWYPQAFTVENPKRVDYILKSLGLEQIADKVGRENIIKFAQETPRVIPPESWGQEDKQEEEQ